MDYEKMLRETLKELDDLQLKSLNICMKSMWCNDGAVFLDGCISEIAEKIREQL